MAPSPDDSQPPSPPTKRLKLEGDRDQHHPPEQPTPLPSSSKGKCKVVDPDEQQSTSNLCGICLSEALPNGVNTVSRGHIDSCDHYFCFVCIMEWAKVESKCPLCKRRFSTIRRPPKPGVFLSERVVNVPVRDQVYHYFGNATIEPPNLYLEVNCSVCHGTSDENLLLLCDLCDSASHTYCVGLGATVPEDDWFCPDCALLRDEQAKSEQVTGCDDQICSGNSYKVPSVTENVSIVDIVREPRDTRARISAEENVSIYDIVREPCDTRVRRSSFAHSIRSPPIATAERTSAADSISHLDSGRGITVVRHAGEPSARTLRRCRDVHDRIQVLRENWDSFRSGSLRFSSNTVDRSTMIFTSNKVDRVSDTNHSRKVEIGDSSVQTHSASSSNQKSASGNDSSAILCNKGSEEVDRAWKLMDIAMKRKQTCERICKSNQASKDPSKQLYSFKHLESHGQRQTVHDHQISGQKETDQLQRFEERNKEQKMQVFTKGKQDMITIKGGRKSGGARPMINLPEYHEFSSIKDVQTSVQSDRRWRNCETASLKSFSGSPSASHGVGGSTSLDSSVASAPLPLGVSDAKMKPHKSSSSAKVEPSEEKSSVGTSCSTAKAKQTNDAKTEIQSLVKLNIKLLTVDEKLDVAEFKIVARLATHSILAACGLEHPKPGIPTFSSSVCCHVSEGCNIRRSTLMLNSCRECFYVFVKDVVNSILSERKR